MALLVCNGTVVLGKASGSGIHAVGGGLTINTGSTVQLGGTGGDQIFDGNTVTINGGTFNLNSLNETVGVLSGAGGTITSSGAATLTLGSGNGSGTNSSTISASVAITKTGSGLQMLSGNNTYSGITTVSGGTLQLGSATALGSSSVTVNDTFTLDLNGNTIGNSFNGVSGNGVSSLGAIINSSVTTPATMNGNILANSAYSFGGAGDITIVGSLNRQSGSGYLNRTKVGSGTVTIANTSDNPYCNLIVNEGVLILAAGAGGTKACDSLYVSSTARLGSAGGGSQNIGSTATVYGGGVLDLNGFNETLTGAGLTIAGNGTGSGALINTNGATTSTLTGSVSLSADTTVGGSANITLAGAVSGVNFGLTKIGTGRLTLTTASTYSGATTVSNGTLVVDNNLVSSAVTNVSAALIATNATFSGSLTLLGSATLSLTNGVAGGTLTVQNGLTLDDGNVLNFDVGATADKIAMTGGTYTKNAGTVTINITTNAGFAVGTYDLISASGITASGFVLGPHPGSYNYTLQVVAGVLQLKVEDATVLKGSVYSFR